MDLFTMLSEVPLQHYLRIIEYLDKVNRAYADCISDDLELEEIELGPTIELPDRILQIILGPNYSEEMERKIILPDDDDFYGVQSTAAK